MKKKLLSSLTIFLLLSSCGSSSTSSINSTTSNQSTINTTSNISTTISSTDTIASTYNPTSTSSSFEYKPSNNQKIIPLIDTTSEELESNPDLDTTTELGTRTNPISNHQISNISIKFLQMQKQYGDSILINADGVNILIDQGQYEDASLINDYLKEYVPSGHLDLLITTHAHSDHYGGVQALEAISSVSYILDYGYKRPNYDSNYLSIRNSYITNGTKYCASYDAVRNQSTCSKRIFLTQEFYLDVLNTNNYIPTTSEASDHNLASVSTLFNFKDFSFLTSGDLTSKGEQEIIDDKNFHSVNLYKASHHCSNGSNSAELLNLANPQAVGISAAIVNSNSPKQSHPGAKALDRIYSYSANQVANKNVYYNGTMGTIDFTTDGLTYLAVRGTKSIKPYMINSILYDNEEDLEFSSTALYKTYYA